MMTVGRSQLFLIHTHTHSPHCGAALFCGPEAQLAHKERKQKDMKELIKKQCPSLHHLGVSRLVELVLLDVESALVDSREHREMESGGKREERERKRETEGGQEYNTRCRHRVSPRPRPRPRSGSVHAGPSAAHQLFPAPLKDWSSALACP